MSTSPDTALTALKEEIEKGLADVKAGRIRKFDADAIIRAGETLRALKVRPAEKTKTGLAAGRTRRVFQQN